MSPSYPRLAGKVAVVTGVADGFGLAHASALSRAGAKVFVADIGSDDAAIEEVRRNGSEVGFITCDVTNQVSLDSMVAEVLSAYGRLDILVNNAAIFSTLQIRPFDQIPETEWDRVMQVNVRGVWQATKAVHKSMEATGGGSVVNIASATALDGSVTLAHYVASQGSLIALTQCLARELGRHKIRVNAIAAGLMESGEVLSNEDWLGTRAQAFWNRAIRRTAVPEDLEGTLVYLASDDAALVTGQTIVVDGGSAIR